MLEATCLVDGCTRSAFCRGWCRPCYGRQWRANRSETQRQAVLRATRDWRARNPDHIRDYNQAWARANPDRRRELHAAAYWADPEAAREKARIWARENPEKRRNREQRRRARKLGSDDPLTNQQWLDILCAHDYRCYYCGRSDRRLQQEHKVPLSRGGAHDCYNVVPACWPCNSRKGARTPEEFLGLVSR